jgi:hypothetical protein
MKIIPGRDTHEGYEHFVNDKCSDCGGIVCGIVHSDQHGCDCGEEEC